MIVGKVSAFGAGANIFAKYQSSRHIGMCPIATDRRHASWFEKPGFTDKSVLDTTM